MHFLSNKTIGKSNNLLKDKLGASGGLGGFVDLGFKIVEKRVSTQNQLGFDKSFYDYLIEKVCGLLWYSQVRVRGLTWGCVEEEKREFSFLAFPHKFSNGQKYLATIYFGFHAIPQTTPNLCILNPPISLLRIHSRRQIIIQISKILPTKAQTSTAWAIVLNNSD